MVENAISEDNQRRPHVRMTFEQRVLKEMRVQAMLMSGGREFWTEGTAKRSVITVVPKSTGESGRTRLEG